MNKQGFVLKLKNLFIEYSLILLLSYIAIQSFQAGLAPLGYYLIIFIFILILYFIYKHKYRIECKEDGLLVNQFVLPTQFIPWKDIYEIGYQSPWCPPEQVILRYRDNCKSKKINLFKSNMEIIDLIKEISLRTNIPIPDKIVKTREKLDRNLRRNETLWGILSIPLTVLAGWNYIKSIPFGFSFENSLWYVSIVVIISCFMIYLINHFEYHPSPKKKIQSYCFLLIISSFILLPNLLIYFSDTWVYFSYGMILSGQLIFNLLLFLPDKWYKHSYAIPLFIITALIAWQGPMYFIPRALSQELNISYGIYDNSFAPDGRLLNYSGNSITFYQVQTKKESSYPFVQSTTESCGYYDFHWSPDGKRLIYQSFNDTDSTRNLYVFNLEQNKYKLLSHNSFPWSDIYPIRYSTKYQYNYYSWSPDSRYFIFKSPVFSNSTIPPEYNWMVYDSLGDTTCKVQHSAYNIGDIWWSSDSTLYYLTYIEKKMGKGKIINYFTLWKASPVFSSTGQWVSNREVKEYVSEIPWGLAMPVFKGNYLFLTETTGKENDYKRYFFSIQQKKKILFPAKMEYCWTPLRNESLHPIEDKLLYTGSNGKTGILYEFDLNTGISREVVREKVYIEEPSYSFDGKRIAYVVNEHLNGSLVSIKSDGTDWKKVSPTIIPEAGYGPLNPIHCWSSVNNTLYYGLMAERFFREKNRVKIYLADMDK